MIEVILINLMSQALWEYAISPLVAAGGGLIGALEAAPAASPFAEVAGLAATRLDRIVESSSSTPDLEAVLRATEVRELVRELYVFDAGSQPDGVTRARAAFENYWRHAAPETADLSDSVFDVLLDAADAILARAISEGNVLAHDTRSAYRQRLILDHVRAVERKEVVPFAVEVRGGGRGVMVTR
jgi:hypothetical protein